MMASGVVVLLVVLGSIAGFCIGVAAERAANGELRKANKELHEANEALREVQEELAAEQTRIATAAGIRLPAVPTFATGGGGK